MKKMYVVVYKHVTQFLCCSNGVSTWAKFDGYIYQGYPVIGKSISPL